MFFLFVAYLIPTIAQRNTVFGGIIHKYDFYTIPPHLRSARVWTMSLIEIRWSRICSLTRAWAFSLIGWIVESLVWIVKKKKGRRRRRYVFQRRIEEPENRLDDRPEEEIWNVRRNERRSHVFRIGKRNNRGNRTAFHSFGFPFLLFPSIDARRRQCPRFPFDTHREFN